MYNIGLPSACYLNSCSTEESCVWPIIKCAIFRHARIAALPMRSPREEDSQPAGEAVVLPTRISRPDRRICLCSREWHQIHNINKEKTKSISGSWTSRYQLSAPTITDRRSQNTCIRNYGIYNSSCNNNAISAKLTRKCSAYKNPVTDYLIRRRKDAVAIFVSIVPRLSWWYPSRFRIYICVSVGERFKQRCIARREYIVVPNCMTHTHVNTTCEERAARGHRRWETVQ